MDLLDLPMRIFQVVLNEVVVTLGLFDAIKLRLVCKVFATQIPNSVIATRLLESGPGRLVGGIWDTALVAKYLEGAPTNSGFSLDFRDFLSSTVRWLLLRKNLEDRKRPIEDLNPMDIRKICTLIATRSQAQFSLAEWDSHAFDIKGQASVNHALACAAFLGLTSFVIGSSRLSAPRGPSRSRRTVFGTPIECAAKGGHCDIIRFFLDMDSDVYEKQDDFQVPLCAAARAGHYNVIQLFLETKYRQLLSGVNFQDVINAAIQGCRPKVILLILESVDIGPVLALSNNMLLEAALHGQIDLVRIALNTGAGGDSYEKKAYYNLALQRAASQGHVDVVELVLTQGKDLFMSLNKYHAVIRATRLGFQRTVQMCLDHGANVNELAADGLSPLEAAAAYGQAGMVKFLIDKVDLEQYPELGISAMLYATQANSPATIRVLARHGIGINEDETQTKIMTAAQPIGNEQVIQALLDAGIFRNTGNSEVSPLESHDAEHGHDDQDLATNGLYHRKALPP